MSLPNNQDGNQCIKFIKAKKHTIGNHIGKICPDMIDLLNKIIFCFLVCLFGKSACSVIC